MELLAKIIAVLLYPVLIVARGVHALTGADPLKLKEDKVAKSHWIVRGKAPTRASYFSEASEVEGVSRPGVGHSVVALVCAAARPLAPSTKMTEGEKFKPAADREQDIPDEVYTLW